MPKLLTPKLISVFVVTALCLILVFPTLRYFAHVSMMGDNPTPEQRQIAAKMLENKQMVKLGLDLQGGADFLLAIDTERLMRQRMENEAESIRTAFRRESVDTTVRALTKDPTNVRITVRVNEPKDAVKAAEALTLYLTSGVSTLAMPTDLKGALTGKGELELTAKENASQQAIAEAMDGAFKVIKDRIDAFGLTMPVVQKAGSDRIRVQIPGENDPERIARTLLRTAALEFRLLHPEHDTKIVEFTANGVEPGLGTGRVKKELLETYINESGKESFRLKENIPNVPAGFVLRLGKQAVIDRATGMEDKSKSVNDLIYLVRSELPLGGGELKRAGVITDPSDLENPIAVTIEFNRKGAEIFKNITTDNTGKRFAIILDDEVRSAPNINEPITGGVARITGGFSQAEASDLSLVLKAGALKAPLQIVTQNAIGPSLGADSIRDSGFAILLGGIMIAILMVIIYGTAGVLAILAMLLNVLMILAILSLLGATLTLSGIGGILLTMGMAVDANILIYERLREEMATGKPLRAAINTAFARALTVIFDSNITSILPALVLVMFAVVDGSVKGFWYAISIGLIANLYTGVFVTKTLVEAVFEQWKTISVGKIRFLHGVNVPWMTYRFGGLAFSGLIAVASLVIIPVNGLNLGIDFTGGVLTTVDLDKKVSQSDLTVAFKKKFEDVNIIQVVGKEQWQITVPIHEDKATGKTPTLEEIGNQVRTVLKETYGDGASVQAQQKVEALLGNEFKLTALASILIAAVVILGYIAIQFQWIFGAGAVLALLHDVFLSLGLYLLLGRSVTLDTVSALLIILGYSVNDTIVVFDRIREKMQDRHSATLMEVMNSAINETLSRTILTGGTTLLAIGTMYLFGGVGLTDFALILLFGVGFGTYSSIFVASALVYVYLEKKGVTTVMAARKATARVAYEKPKTAKE